jgi:hypothetical protein
MIHVTDLDFADTIAPDPVRVSNVEAALRALNPSAEFLGVHAEGMDKLLYSTVPENFDGLHNHFQGLQRLYDGRHLVISGSNWHDPPRGSELYIAELGSRPAHGPWLSNLVRNDEPPPEDRIVSAVTVDHTRRWSSNRSTKAPSAGVSFPKAAKT